MKKNLVLIASLIIISFNLQFAFSAGIYENANQSAEFVRTLTRYSSTEIDAAFYNPAGTAFMTDGFYAYLSDQMLFDYQKMTDSSPALSMAMLPSEYEGEAMTWAFPDIYAVYKQNNWSLFMNAGLIGRGAAATYNNSIPMVNKLLVSTLGMPYTSGKLEAYAYFVGITAGGAYKINDMFSVGGAVRYIHAEQNTSLKYQFPDPTKNIDFSVSANGNSAGFIGSFDVMPSKDMNIGFRYQYYTTMKVKNEKPSNSQAPAAILYNPYFSFISEGYTQKQTLPMNASVGVSYMVTAELKAEAGFIYYFNKLADWGNDMYGQSIAKKYDNGYDASISLEYAFIPQLKGSVGYSYTVSGVNSKTRTNQQLGLTANTVALGGTYNFSNGVNFTLAAMKNFFKEAKVENASPDFGSTKYEDDVYGVGASISYKFF